MPELSDDGPTELYRLAGVTPPIGARTKPPCCGEDSAPPEWSDELDELVDQAQAVERRHRR